MKVLLLILLAVLLVGSTVSSSSADSKLVEPNWLSVYTTKPELGRVFYNQHREDGETIYGQMLVVYPSPLVYSGKRYTSRVTGVAVNCKNSAFIVMYDLYYTKTFPGLYDDAVASVKHDVTTAKAIVGNNNIVYQTFCALVV